jgi:hypothetical protein
VQAGQLHRDADDGRHGHPHRPRGRHRDHVHQVLVDQPGDTDLVERLHRGHGFSRTDAYHLLGQVGRLQVGNMIDPFFSVLATVERRYLEPS